MTRTIHDTTTVECTCDECCYQRKHPQIHTRVSIERRMTYGELKAELEKLTLEQLAQHVVWSGDERGGYVRNVWIADEDWIGDRSDGETWSPRSEAVKWMDPSEVETADVCLPKGTVNLMVD